MIRRLSNIPTRLEDLYEYSLPCDCGKVHSVDMKGASIRKKAFEEIVFWVREIDREALICMVVDRITKEVLGNRVGELLTKSGHRIRWCEIPDDDHTRRPHADEHTLQFVENCLRGCGMAVAVGSGTVSDLTKLGTWRNHIPYLAIPTAPSMNGYTSAIAALSIKGVKRTLPCHQPVAVLADVEIISKAPKELILSGLGDLESKPTACADFRLAGLIRKDYYCRIPEEVVMHAEAKVADAAAGIGEGDTQALGWLMEALLLSGISMKLAGSSGPASGAEHLISHFWDMTAGYENRQEGWHGSQVGVATIVTATLYDHLRLVDPNKLDWDRLAVGALPREQVLRHIEEIFGELGAEVSTEYVSKYLAPPEHEHEIRHIRQEWDAIWNNLSDVLRPGERVRSVLHAAGAPTSMKEIGLEPGHLKKALHAAHYIRSRFTVLDFARQLELFPTMEQDALVELVS